MISLVTQSDGSARRLPLVSLAIVAAMAATYFGYAEEMEHARVEAGFAMADAIEYFEEYPYVELPSRMEPYLAAERVEEVRAAYEAEWEALGLRRIPERLKRRVQDEFDALVEPALARYAALPANAHAYRGSEDAPLRYLDHAFYHATLAALLLSILVVALVGTPLEDVWGSFAFAGFCGAMIPFGALLYGALHPEGAAAWIGGSGLAAALLGAAASRWLDSGSPRLLGAIPLASWLVIPAWLVAEYVAVRQIAATDLGTAPLVVHGAIVASGFFAGFALRALGVEERLTDRWDDEKEPVRNPKLEQAMRLREDGKRDEAMLMLRAAFDKKADPDVATAMWDVAKELGTPEVGLPAALWRVRHAVRRKEPRVAIEFWSEIVGLLDRVDAEPPLFVKLADMQQAAGRGDDVAQTLDRMLTASEPPPGAMAVRAVELAKGDAALASRIAAAGLQSGSVSRSERRTLEAVVQRAEHESFGDGAGEHRSAQSGGGEPLRVKTRVLPAFQGLVAKPSEAPPTGELPDPEAEPVPGVDSEAIAGTFAASDLDDIDVEALDPNALALDDLGEDELVEGAVPEPAPADTDTDADAERDALFGESLDVGDYGAVDEAALMGEAIHVESEEQQLDAIGESAAADPEEIERWNSPGLVQDLSAQLPDAEQARPAEQAQPPAAGEAVPGPVVDAVDPTDEVDDPNATSGRRTLPIFDDAPAVGREKKRLGAVPIALSKESIEIDVEGRGKTAIPLGRIEAIAVGAVRDLGDKPVVLIDLVLNWSGDPAEPLKLLRIRSDRFDPRALLADCDNGVAALRGLIEILVDGARPVCLPDEPSVRGEPFAVFDTVEAYEQATVG